MSTYMKHLSKYRPNEMTNMKMYRTCEGRDKRQSSIQETASEASYINVTGDKGEVVLVNQRLPSLM